MRRNVRPDVDSAGLQSPRYAYALPYARPHRHADADSLSFPDSNPPAYAHSDPHAHSDSHAYA